MDDLIEDPELYDEQARNMGRIMGASLDAQIENARYLISRGRGNPSGLKMMLRAKELYHEDRGVEWTVKS